MQKYFNLHPSRTCAALLFCVFSLAILIVLLLPIVELAKAAIASLLLFGLVYYLRRDAWMLLPSSPVAIHLDGSTATLITRAGDEIFGKISRDSLVTPKLTVLNVLAQGNNRLRSVVIFPDSMGNERFRELRVLLKWDSNDVIT